MAACPPEGANLDAGGRILVMAVPVVGMAPSRKASATKACVSAGLIASDEGAWSASSLVAQADDPAAIHDYLGKIRVAGGMCRRCGQAARRSRRKRIIVRIRRGA